MQRQPQQQQQLEAACLAKSVGQMGREAKLRFVT